jgi:hypothetical protein
MATNNPAVDKNKAGTAAPGNTFLRVDFPVIRNATLLFVFSLLLGTALVTGTQYLQDDRQNALNQAQAMENSSHDSYRLAEIEKSEVHDFQPKYQQLVQDGFIGTERRLDWIDSIAAVQKRAGLEPVTYDIAEQAVFLVDPQIDTGTMELHGSQMHFTMNLLHEMDLLRFLNGIQGDQITGMHKCVIKRWSNAAPAELAPHLQAECSLYWITLGNHAADADAAPPILQGP